MQYATESFNALLWNRWPKTELASLRTAQTAAPLAVLQVNEGACIISRVPAKLELDYGVHTRKHVQQATKVAFHEHRQGRLTAPNLKGKSGLKRLLPSSVVLKKAKLILNKLE